MIVRSPTVHPTPSGLMFRHSNYPSQTGVFCSHPHLDVTQRHVDDTQPIDITVTLYPMVDRHSW